MTDPRENTPVAGGHVAAGDEHEIQTADIAGAGRAEQPAQASPSEKEPEKPAGNGAELEPLFADDAEKEFRTRWREIQGSFVDEPRAAVEQADQLVAQVMQYSTNERGEGVAAIREGRVIFQDSSGGENWQSSNHVAANGELSVQFRGYESAVTQPLEGCREELVAVGLPHRVVRRTAEIEQHFVLGAEVREVIAHALRQHLLVVDAGHHQRRRAHALDGRFAEAPYGRARRAPHALSPGRADGIGPQHLAPHGRGGRGLVLIRATDLPLPVGREIGVRLRVERDAGRRARLGRLLARGAQVRRREQHELRDLVGVARGVAARARPAERPADQAYARHVAQRAEHPVVERLRLAFQHLLRDLDESP